MLKALGCRPFAFGQPACATMHEFDFGRLSLRLATHACIAGCANSLFPARRHDRYPQLNGRPGRLLTALLAGIRSANQRLRNEKGFTSKDGRQIWIWPREPCEIPRCRRPAAADTVADVAAMRA